MSQLSMLRSLAREYFGRLTWRGLSLRKVRWPRAQCVELLEDSRLLAATVNLDQWANSQLEWQNGNLGSSNSSYGEGDSVPFHLVFEGLLEGHSYTVMIEWDTTQGSGCAHASVTAGQATDKKSWIRCADAVADVISCARRRPRRRRCAHASSSRSGR